MSAHQERDTPVVFEAGSHARQIVQVLKRIVQVRIQSGIDDLALALAKVVVANLACERVDLRYGGVDLIVEVSGDV